MEERKGDKRGDSIVHMHMNNFVSSKSHPQVTAEINLLSSF